LGDQVTYTELSRLTGKTFRTLKDRLEKSAVEPIKRDGRSIWFDSEKALPAIYAAKGKEGDLVLEEERALLTNEQCRKAKRDNDLADSLVFPVEVLVEVLSKATGQISSVLDALPLTLKKRSPNLTARDIEFIRKEIAKCRNAAAQAAIDGTATLK